jgi:uncharacterized membrane protein/protein-disulfide isomerase
MSKRAAVAALVCAAVGLAASVAAAYTHYHLLNDPTYRSFCDVSERVSCTSAYMSRFSTVQGVPVALFGALWFIVAGLLAAAGLTARDSVRENIPGYLFVSSTIALAVVLYLGYASVVILKTVCVLCLTTYAAVIGLFIVSGAATSFPMTTLPRRAVRDIRVLAGSPLAIAIAILFFAGAASTLAFFPRDVSVAAASGGTPAVTQDQRSELERFMATSQRVPLIVPTEGAKVLIVKFNDYQCPACGQSFLQYKPIFAKYEASNPGAVRVVMKDYPLNKDCNSNVAQTIHPAACDAAVAVRLARQHNRAEAMEEWLYTHQETMTPPAVRAAARDVGGVTDFEAKLPATLESVKSDVALGRQLGIRSTPTFFINGIKVEGMMAPQFFDQAIAYELAHPRQGG